MNRSEKNDINDNRATLGLKSPTKNVLKPKTDIFCMSNIFSNPSLINEEKITESPSFHCSQDENKELTSNRSIDDIYKNYMKKSSIQESSGKNSLEKCAMRSGLRYIRLDNLIYELVNNAINDKSILE